MEQYVLGCDLGSPDGDYGCLVLAEVLEDGRLKILGLKLNPFLCGEDGVLLREIEED